MRDFIVSARKYRPSRFDEVIGQEHVTVTLKNALKGNKLAHAFLFCGPRGVGKTTCARILAKVINCEKPTAEHEPCNECSSCLAFAKNKSMNIAELDAASHNSVDNIRDLVNQVRYAPQQGTYKVYIIDEVHMLSQAAFNAFLKTLEEPPDYAIFILATTEKHKILPTILSRCQIYDFSRITVADTVKHLQKICIAEGIEAEEQALQIIAEKADGALRDALSLFDRLVSAGNNVLKYKQVISQLHILDYDYYFRAFDMIVGEDIPGTLLLFDEILRLGFEPDHFLLGLSEHLRNLLMCRYPNTVNLLDVTEAVKSRYLEQANLSTANFILSLLNLASECDSGYRLARNKKLHVEMSLIKMCHVSSILSSGPFPIAQSAGPEKAVHHRPVATTAKPPEAKPYSAMVKPDKAEEKHEIKEVSEERAETVPEKPAPVVKKIADDTQILSLEAIQKQIQEAQLKKNEESEVKSVPDTEKLEEALAAYIESVDSKSLAGFLKSAVCRVEEDAAYLVVYHQVAKDTIAEAPDLTAFFHRYCNCGAFELRVIIDKSLKAEEEQKPKPSHLMSDAEKYRELTEINPEIKHFRDLFDLTPK